ncbi:MAG TPA: flagellar biosynthetic protein FliR [Devosiaceae bacterium]|nr:flagellar biosynthetic protein FliR [Devosiaceae bacterium]
MTVGLNWLPQTAFAFMLIFARVGTILMFIPALGESSIPARLRLTFALALTLVLLPLLSPRLPVLPDELGGIGLLMFHEIAIGLILGGITRFVVMAAELAGTTIAYQIGLSMAQGSDLTSAGSQGVIIANFLSMLGITLVFATNLHHFALSAIVQSYQVFSPSDPLMIGDAAQMALRAVSGAFTVGVQMAAPFIVFGLVFNVGLGILARLMPALQVYFLSTPATIGIGLFLFVALLSMMMGWYLTHVRDALSFLAGR